MMYGPEGLASIVSAATGACRPEAVSFTLEIHQVEGRCRSVTPRGCLPAGGTPPTPSG